MLLTKRIGTVIQHGTSTVLTITEELRDIDIDIGEMASIEVHERNGKKIIEIEKIETKK